MFKVKQENKPEAHLEAIKEYDSKNGTEVLSNIISCLEIGFSPKATMETLKSRFAETMADEVTLWVAAGHLLMTNQINFIFAEDN